MTAPAAAGFGSLYLVVTLLTARRLDDNSIAAAHAHDQRFRTVQEGLGGIRDVIIDSSQDLFLATYSRVDRRFNDARASTLFIGSAPRAIIESGALVLVALLAVLLWHREGSIGPALPILGALAIGAFRLLPMLQQLFYSCRYGLAICFSGKFFIGNRATTPPASSRRVAWWTSSQTNPNSRTS